MVVDKRDDGGDVTRNENEIWFSIGSMNDGGSRLWIVGEMVVGDLDTILGSC